MGTNFFHRIQLCSVLEMARQKIASGVFVNKRRKKSENLTNQTCRFKWPNKMKEALLRSRLEGRYN